MYKYSCRKCPIRRRCIDEREYTISTRDMIQHAFNNRTDTLATWGLLQRNCLLIKAEEEQEKRAREGSDTLTRRLREVRKAREREAKKKNPGGTEKRKKSVIRRLPQARKAREEAAKARAEQEHDEQRSGSPLKRSDQTPDYLQPVSPGSSRTGARSGEMRPGGIGSAGPDVAQSPAPQPGRTPRKPCWLTVGGSKRHIALPLDGELVLGRFDANFGVPPDVDLAQEDANNNTVSRRHARIGGKNGYHSIEDTGSRQGVRVNGEQIKPGSARPLKPGDRVAVGGVRMVYEEIPGYLLDKSGLAQARHLLIVTPTGRKLPITPPEDIVIGRSDRYVESAPDIDLSQDGQAATRVSRRHAAIHWKNDRPYLEDLGSGFGTRLNGRMVLLGQAIPLKPGDHIWLGGCVLAYDVEV